MLDALTLDTPKREQLEEATASYEKQMPAHVARYLMDRGIPAEAGRGARLGFVQEAMPGHEAFQNRICIPYLTAAGVVGLKFRAFGDESGPKYMGLPGQHQRLYGVDALRHGHSTVAIVEGELDAIVMTHAVGVPAVGVPGAPTWLKHWPRCFADVERVLVVCDNDADNEQNPGQALARKIVKDIRGATLVVPPSGDVTDWYLAEGREAIRKRLGVSL